MRNGLAPVAVGPLNLEAHHAEFNVNGDTRSNSPREVEIASRSITPLPIPEPAPEAASRCHRTASKILFLVSPITLGGWLLFAILKENMDPTVRIGSGVACAMVSVVSAVSAWRLFRN